MPLGWIVFWWVLVFIAIIATIILANALTNKKTRNITLMCMFGLIVLMLIFGIAFFIPWGSSSNTINPGRTVYFVSQQNVSPVLSNEPVTITLTNSTTGTGAGTVTILASGSSRVVVSGFVITSGTTSGNNYWIGIENTNTYSATVSVSSSLTYRGPLLSAP